MSSVGDERSAGASLVELLLVLAVIAAVIRFAGGGWLPGDSGRALAAAQGVLAGQLEAARITAALRQRPGRLLILADQPGNGTPDGRLRQCTVVTLSPDDRGLWLPEAGSTLLPEPIRLVPPSAPEMPPPRTWGTAPRSNVGPAMAVRVRVDGQERIDHYHVVEFSPRGTAVGVTLLLSPSIRPAADRPVRFLEPADLRGIRVSQYGFFTLLADAGAF